MNAARGLLLFLSAWLHGTVLSGSHSLTVLLLFLKGETPFPEFSLIFMLDDITVGYFDSEKKTYIPRGYDKEVEDDGVIDTNELRTITTYIHDDMKERWYYAKYDLNHTENIHVQQRLAVCELMDNGKPGPITTKNAIRGSTVDEFQLYDGKHTYHSTFNVTEDRLRPYLNLVVAHFNIIYYPACMNGLKAYLEKRSYLVKRRVKPRVRLIQKPGSVSGRSEVSCLATGFYPRHLNLTLLRDGQPVDEHLITGGDLLPNADGTYQMRKNLELSEEESKQRHKYSCSAVLLSLDNKLDVHLDFDPGEPIVVPALTTLALVLIFVLICSVCIICKRRSTASFKREYVSANNQEVEETPRHNLTGEC